MHRQGLLQHTVTYLRQSTSGTHLATCPLRGMARLDDGPAQALVDACERVAGTWSPWVWVQMADCIVRLTHTCWWDDVLIADGDVCLGLACLDRSAPLQGLISLHH